MKKIIIIAAFALMGFCASAQTAKDVYSKYSDEKGVTAVYVSPAVFKMLKNFNIDALSDGEVDIKPIVQSLKGLYLIETERADLVDKIAADVKVLEKKHNYELWMEVKDDGDLTRIYIETSGNKITSFLLTSRDSSSITFLTIDGEIRQEDLEKLIAQND